MKALYGRTIKVETNQMRGRTRLILTLNLDWLSRVLHLSKLMARRESMMT